MDARSDVRSRRPAPVTAERIDNHAAFIWSVADLLRGDYKPSEYGRVMLPFTVLRRLDCVLDPVKDEMLTKSESVKGRVENFGPVLDALTDIDGLWNTSRFDLPKLLNDPDNLAANLPGPHTRLLARVEVDPGQVRFRRPDHSPGQGEAPVPRHVDQERAVDPPRRSAGQTSLEEMNDGPARTRTWDQGIMSPLL